MYLRGSKWNMAHRRGRRPSPWRIILLLVLIGAALYINQVVVPATQPLFVPTATPTRSPESYYNDAKVLYEAGKLTQAIDAYRLAIMADPDNPSIYLDMARAMIFTARYADALEAAERALLLNNQNPTAYAMKAWALDFTQDFTSAEGAIKNALDLKPDDAFAHAVYAEILIDKYLSGQGDFTTIDKAAEESKTAVNLAPNMLETHRARGYVLWNTGNYEEAIQEYKSALAVNNKIADLHMALGYNYRLTGEYDRALDSFNQALALNPTDPNPPLEISRTYATVGDFSKAAQYAEQAVKTNPANARLHGNYGVMLYKNANAQNKPELLDGAIQQLALAVHGGTLEDGAVVEGLPLNYGSVAEFYAIYGLALAKANRCNEAVPVFYAILAGLPDDEINVYNAQQGLILCQVAVEETPGSPEGAQATEAP